MPKLLDGDERLGEHGQLLPRRRTWTSTVRVPPVFVSHIGEEPVPGEHIGPGAAASIEQQELLAVSGIVAVAVSHEMALDRVRGAVAQLACPAIPPGAPEERPTRATSSFGLNGLVT
jgi:hypothetical protein